MAYSLKQAVKQKVDNQLRTNAARRILSAVQSWGLKPEIAAFRWPCELLQNSIDTTKRHPAKQLAVNITLGPNSLSYEHDGGPFQAEDIGALILAGSAKPFDNSPYTGRFGSGFLVTHALSPYVRVAGRAEGFDQGFDIALDRQGSETEVQENIERCYDALERPAEITEVDAKFEYQFKASDGAQVARNGLATLDGLLPYIFAFNPCLVKVHIRQSSDILWCRQAEEELQGDGTAIRLIRLSRIEDSEETQYGLYVGLLGQEGTAAVQVEYQDSCQKLIVLEPTCPRIFRSLPLYESENSGLPVVVDGPFVVDEERTALFLTADNQSAGSSNQGEDWKVRNHSLALQIVEQLAPFLSFVAQLDVTGAENALAIRKPTGHLSEATVWVDALRALAKNLASRPVVKTSGYCNHAPDDCLFPIPNVDPHVQGIQVNSDLFWEVLLGFGKPLPQKEIAKAWTRITDEWEELGVKLEGRRNVVHAIDFARDAEHLTGLAGMLQSDENEAITWLGKVLDCLAPHAGKIPREVLSGALPDQTGTFKNTEELAIDTGIDETVKELASTIGCPLKSRLLDKRLLPSTPDHPRFDFLRSQVSNKMSAEEAVQQVVEVARHKLKERERQAVGHRLGEEDSCIDVTARMLVWLACNRPTYDAYAQDIPLLSEGGKLLVDPEDTTFLPCEAWCDEAKPYRDVFPESTRLSSVYFSHAGDAWPTLQAALIGWGRCYGDLVVVEGEIRLKAEFLSKLVVKPIPIGSKESEYVCEKFSQIPFIGQIEGRIGKDVVRAQQFLSFLLKHVIHRDSRWQATAEAKAVRVKDFETLVVRPSRWLGHVLRDKWVPDTGSSDEDAERVTATANSLREIVPWDEISEDSTALEFLKLFGFDELELWINATSGGDTEEGQKLRDQLAGLAHALGRDGLVDLPSILEAQRERAEKVKRNREFGLRVQGLVKELLEEYGIVVEIVDYGYDLAVYEKGDADIDTDWGAFSLGKYFVEVKATRSHEVRMTSLQAKTAVSESERYVLCVVDLRDTLSLEPAVGEVADRALMVCKIGEELKPLVEGVDRISDASGEIRVDQTAGLRYCVGAGLWTRGQPIRAWVVETFGG